MRAIDSGHIAYVVNHSLHCWFDSKEPTAYFHLFAQAPRELLLTFNRPSLRFTSSKKGPEFANNDSRRCLLLRMVAIQVANSHDRSESLASDFAGSNMAGD